jgi:hypothetical protein
VGGGEKVRESEQQDVVEELGVEALHCVGGCACVRGCRKCYF